jgi:hypothetical protein
MKLPERCSSPFPLDAPAREPDSSDALRCLSSGYLAERGRCERRIPERVVESAWRSELAAGSSREGFFRLTWRGGQWLAYGHPDGHVRGVYCPEHAADRDQRAVAERARDDAVAPAPHLVA